MITLVRPKHLLNSSSAMLVMLLGMVMAVRPEELNAPDPMLVTLAGIVTPARLLQLRNARDSILVTLAGIVMPVSADESNAAIPIVVTPLGIVKLPLIPAGY